MICSSLKKCKKYFNLYENLDLHNSCNKLESTTYDTGSCVLNIEIIKNKIIRYHTMKVLASLALWYCELWNGNVWKIPSLLRYCGRPTKGQTTFPTVLSLGITTDEDAQSSIRSIFEITSQEADNIFSLCFPAPFLAKWFFFWRKNKPLDFRACIWVKPC